MIVVYWQASSMEEEYNAIEGKVLHDNDDVDNGD